MKIVAVNGRRFSIDNVRRAIADSRYAGGAIELIVDNSGYFKTASCQGHRLHYEQPRSESYDAWSRARRL